MDLAEKQAEFSRKNAAELEGNSVPLPGPAGDAFASGPIVVGQYSVRKVVHYDWRKWQETNNALVRSLKELEKPEGERDVILDNGDEAVVVWMLTHTPLDCDRAMKSGVEQFKELCKVETEMVMEMHIFADVLKACMEQVSRSCATALKYATEKEDEGSTTFFQVSKVSSQTASGG